MNHTLVFVGSVALVYSTVTVLVMGLMKAASKEFPQPPDYDEVFQRPQTQRIPVTWE